MDTNKLQQKPGYVENMFSSIAGTYDLLNTVLSLNRDGAWRRFTVERMALKDGDHLLDVATGTAKLAIALSKKVGKGGRVTGVDFSQEMLDVGKENLKKEGIGNVILQREDAMALPFEDNSFDGATIAFGLRNLPDTEKGLREMVRVVKPGGKVGVLEFAMPVNPAMKALYKFYFFKILPFLGNIVSRGNGAYTYLPHSVLEFPGPQELKRIMEKEGLKNVKYNILTLGVVAVHVGEK